MRTQVVWNLSVVFLQMKLHLQQLTLSPQGMAGWMEAMDAHQQRQTPPDLQTKASPVTQIQAMATSRSRQFWRPLPARKLRKSLVSPFPQVLLLAAATAAAAAIQTRMAMENPHLPSLGPTGTPTLQKSDQKWRSLLVSWTPQRRVRTAKISASMRICCAKNMVCISSSAKVELVEFLRFNLSWNRSMYCYLPSCKICIKHVSVVTEFSSWVSYQICLVEEGNFYMAWSCVW